MFDYTIPVKKLGIDVPVTVPNEQQDKFHAWHGLKQEVNDALAGHARADFDSDESFHETGLKKIAKVIAKIQAGQCGMRAEGESAKAKKLAAAIGDYTDDELAVMLAARDAARLKAAA